jgi:hypothetical protein
MSGRPNLEAVEDYFLSYLRKSFGEKKRDEKNGRKREKSMKWYENTHREKRRGMNL